MQQSHQALLDWATAHGKPTVIGSSTQRLVVARSLIGHLAEAADMSAAFIGHLQSGTYVLAAHAGQTENDATALLDLEQRWTSLLSMDAPHATNGHAADAVPSSHPFPSFQPAHRPAIGNWNGIGAALGASAAPTLVVYGGICCSKG